MEMKFWRSELKLSRRWTIASKLGPGGGGGSDVFGVVFVELRDVDGLWGLGESAPSNRYLEDQSSTIRFLEQVNAARLSFADVAGSMRYLESITAKDFAPKGALNIALLDGAARSAGQPVHDFLGLGFQERKHVTSFSIGIDTPDVVRQKVLEAERFPILKLKVGSPEDRQILMNLRAVAPGKSIRVDANEAWKTKEEALTQLEWLASDGHIQFVEQPMPASVSAQDWAWLKSRTPLPIMADESYRSAGDIAQCAECFHAVNVKLVKAGGISGAFDALRAARRAGLKTMLGCMIESSILISAAAHLAELTDYLDIDGNLLISNDPYLGATAEKGVISFAQAPEKFGLRVGKRSNHS
jgi:L-alanine-DL-glutamate epimerase-like enolase superfamily enzyme